MAAESNRDALLEYRNLNMKQRGILAGFIARDNLAKVNARCEEINVPDTFYTRYGKRALDIIISFLALVISSPVILLVLIITYFDVGRPIIFRQTRVGKDGKPFTLSKPRNMTNECNENGVLLPAEERVTKWGHFARKTSLDELLNFWCVLKGDMSIIGPRPLPEFYYPLFSKRHAARFKVRPGLECPLHDPAMGDMSWDNRFENDVWYVQHISFAIDVKMLILLFREVFCGSNKEQRADGYMGGDFLGYTEDGRVMTSEHIPQKYMEELKQYMDTD